MLPQASLIVQGWTAQPCLSALEQTAVKAPVILDRKSQEAETSGCSCWMIQVTRNPML